MQHTGVNHLCKMRLLLHRFRQFKENKINVLILLSKMFLFLNICLVETKSNQDPKELEDSTTEKTIELCLSLAFKGD